MGLEDITHFPSYLLAGEQRAADYLWRSGHVPLLLDHPPDSIPKRVIGSPTLYVFDYHSLGHIDAPDSVSIITSIDDVAHAQHQQDLGDKPNEFMAKHNRVLLTPPSGASVHYWELTDNSLEYVRSSRYNPDKKPYFARLSNLFSTDEPLAPRSPDFERGWPDYS